MKIGFIFAGQGQQFLYMGQDLVDEYKSAHTLYKQAEAILGYDLLNLDQDKLNQTQYTQPALFVLGVVLDTILKQHNVNPNIVAGLSLGEYNALYSAGVFDFETGLKLIEKRAKLMSEAFELKETSMAACVRTDRETVASLIKDTGIEICNVNTYSQIVIGGYTKDLEVLLPILKQNKVRALPLKVSCVSHMSLLKEASEDFGKILETVEFKIPKIKFINNVDAMIQEDNFKDSLKRQISQKTELALSIQKMIDMDVTRIIEVGPKNTISKFVKEINKDIETFNVYDINTLKEYYHE